MGGISTKLEYLEKTKEQIAAAIADKGVEIEDTDTFRSYAEKIAEIPTGSTITQGAVNTAIYTTAEITTEGEVTA